MFVSCPIMGFAEVEQVAIEYKGKQYDFIYNEFDEPKELDISKKITDRDSAFNTLMSYHYAMKNLKNMRDYYKFARMSDGLPGPNPKNQKKFMKNMRSMVKGKIKVHGELAFQNLNLYIVEYPKNKGTLIGVSVGRLGDQFYVIRDVSIVNDFIAQVERMDYNIDSVITTYAKNN